MAYLIRLLDEDGGETHLCKTVDLTVIPRVGERVDTGSAALGEQPVSVVAWHRGKGGIDLGRCRAPAGARAELGRAGWEAVPSASDG
ncbi:MAG TPA: hypothetical protein VHX88_18790 [Solirubrobacteraceae bacterium]|nr:hypothetical protein [Solirubrobacteraceae bacterium]